MAFVDSSDVRKPSCIWISVDRFPVGLEPDAPVNSGSSWPCGPSSRAIVNGNERAPPDWMAGPVQHVFELNQNRLCGPLQCRAAGRKLANLDSVEYRTAEGVTVHQRPPDGCGCTRIKNSILLIEHIAGHSGSTGPAAAVSGSRMRKIRRFPCPRLETKALFLAETGANPVIGRQLTCARASIL